MFKMCDGKCQGRCRFCTLVKHVVLVNGMFGLVYLIPWYFGYGSKVMALVVRGMPIEPLHVVVVANLFAVAEYLLPAGLSKKAVCVLSYAIPAVSLAAVVYERLMMR